MKRNRSYQIVRALFTATVIAGTSITTRAEGMDADEPWFPRTMANVRKANIKRFGSCTEARLATLMSESDDSVALRAAWERVIRTLPEEEQAEAVSANHETVAWFTGFAEGRLRITAPEWWARAIHVRAYSAERVFSREADVLPYQESDAGLAAPLAVHLKKAGAALQLTVGDDQLALSRELIDPKQNGGWVAGLNAAFDSDRCFVALHSGVGDPYRLACIDRKTRSIRWRSDVFAAGATAMRGGPGFHCVDLKLDGERIVVFGGSDEGPYVEGFATDTGRNCFRFSTAY